MATQYIRLDSLLFVFPVLYTVSYWLASYVKHIARARLIRPGTYSRKITCGAVYHFHLINYVFSWTLNFVVWIISSYVGL